MLGCFDRQQGFPTEIHICGGDGLNTEPSCNVGSNRERDHNHFAVKVGIKEPMYQVYYAWKERSP